MGQIFTIYLDFDGTLVEHEYPKIGRCNFGCVEIVKKLQEAGHKVLLNTMRCEFKDGTLEKAEHWLKNSWMVVVDRDLRDSFQLDHIPSTERKHSPGYWDWDFFKANDLIMIDDQTRDIPLKRAVMTNGFMVDWEALDKQFQEHDVY